MEKNWRVHDGNIIHYKNWMWQVGSLDIDLKDRMFIRTR